MLYRSLSNPVAVALTTKCGVQIWGSCVIPARSSSTMRSSVARMLLSTNSSRIVDVSHENELRHGLKTSGEKQDYDEKNKSIAQEMKDGARDMKDKSDEKMSKLTGKISAEANIASDSMQEMADRTKQNLKEMSKDMDNTSEGSFSKLDAMSVRSKDDLGNMEDTAMDYRKPKRVNMGIREDPAKEVVEDMRRVGNVNRIAGNSNLAAGREQESSNDPERIAEALGREKLDRNAAESYDVADRMRKESSKMASPQDQQAYHDIPGSNNPQGKNLRGTEDNFDDDPAISFGDIQDKARETKEKITGGKDQLLDSMRKSMKSTGQGIKETVKGMTEAAKETVQNTTVKTKEFLTGERESEKPDETKSETRTTDKKYPQNKGPSQPQSSEESTKW